ncbi:M48 family metallopeptidase [Thalassotalea crassostreae]|uniref:M48 family metallopeptidase n=1 Tax=Thalassotalea crassostreae TaxID=1763536 RepID=UPI0008396703|nr:SprT family zinc-dependent metalloprotease [Thalassotalea crassostreae]
MSLPEYQLTRSRKRKTISLQVKAGKVRVLAPMHVTIEYIDQLISKKASWLLSKVNEQLNYLENKLEKQYQSGDAFYYLGKPYQLLVRTTNIADDGLYSVSIDAENIIVDIAGDHNSDYIQQALKIWYQQQAEKILKTRLTLMEAKTGLTSTKLKVRHYKTRWGSCNSKKQINLNSLLVMAKEDVIDYVIVHELCHTIHMNHSSLFWQLVEQNCPDYKLYKAWLKSHQDFLTW